MQGYYDACELNTLLSKHNDGTLPDLSDVQRSSSLNKRPILSFRANRGISSRFKCREIKEGEIPRFARNDRPLGLHAGC
jgi:hypothetical protein